MTLLEKRVGDLVVGDPLDEETDVGPLGKMELDLGPTPCSLMFDIAS